MADKSAEETREKPSLSQDVSELLTAVRSHSRRLSRVKKLLRKIDGKQPQAADYETWLTVSQGLADYDVAIDAVDQGRKALVERIDNVLKRLKIKARMAFLTKLNMLADAQKISVEKLSESPLVLYVAPLTFEIDFEQGGVDLLFGHECIDSDLPIDANALIEAHATHAGALTDDSLASEAFFDLLYDAYQTVLARTHGDPHSRVDLVDVLVPLAMLRADDKALRKKGLDALQPFSRALLAWQLAQLRRDGLLERNGRRLDLGAATGGSTRNKKDVLYIPVGPKNGQYYGSLRFTQS